MITADFKNQTNVSQRVMAKTMQPRNVFRSLASPARNPLIVPEMCTLYHPITAGNTTCSFDVKLDLASGNLRKRRANLVFEEQRRMNRISFHTNLSVTSADPYYANCARNLFWHNVWSMSEMWHLKKDCEAQPNPLSSFVSDRLLFPGAPGYPGQSKDLQKTASFWTKENAKRTALVATGDHTGLLLPAVTQHTPVWTHTLMCLRWLLQKSADSLSFSLLIWTKVCQ